MLVVSLICQRGGDLLNVYSVQVEHLLKVEPEAGVLEGLGRVVADGPLAQ